MTTNSAKSEPVIAVTVREARRAASDWVTTIGAGLPGFAGAWLAGSVAWVPDEDIVPDWSDVDVMVALHDGVPPKIGKLLHRGVLLEISFIAEREVSTAAMTANYRVGCSFEQGRILADPDGELERVQSDLRPTFWTPASVRDRIGQARTATLAGLLPAPAPDTRSRAWQAMWVFPAGLPTHLVLLGAGQNPTVRRCYEKVQPVFAAAGMVDLYETLLAATGYGSLTRSEVLGHWEATQELFDLAAPHSATATPFFASDISQIARPISIEGTLTSIEQGFHRETLFWLVATQARSLAILEQVAPYLVSTAVTSSFTALLDAIGIGTSTDRTNRTKAILELLPAIEAFSLDFIRS